MRTLYIDLNEGWSENYSPHPKRYGGGRVFAAVGLQTLNDPQFPHNELWIYAGASGFECDDAWDDKGRCVVISEEDKKKLREGTPVKDIIPNADRFDIICHHFHNVHLNVEGLKCKVAVWLVGYLETPHPEIENILLYSRKYQQPNILNKNAKIYDVKIGVDIPQFKAYIRSDYVFCCQRHWKYGRSNEIAQWANKEKITAIFAGPISEGYDLKDHIDNKNSHYIGEIGQQLKIDYLKQSRLFACVWGWECPFNLGAVEALSYGTPVACDDRRGFWPELIQDGVNGFVTYDPADLSRAYQLTPFVSQLTCWQSIHKYSSRIMVRSFTDAFNRIVQ